MEGPEIGYPLATPSARIALYRVRRIIAKDRDTNPCHTHRKVGERADLRPITEGVFQWMRELYYRAPASITMPVRIGGVPFARVGEKPIYRVVRVR